MLCFTDPDLGTRRGASLQVVSCRVREDCRLEERWGRPGDLIKISCAVALMTAIGDKTRTPNGVKRKAWREVAMAPTTPSWGRTHSH